MEQSPFAPFASQFEEQEREAGETGKTISSVETHCFGEEQLFQPYLFDRSPLYKINNKEEHAGTILHGKKLHFSTGLRYYFEQKELPCWPEEPFTLLIEKPDNDFTDPEYEVVFLLLQQECDCDQKECDKAMAEKLRSASDKSMNADAAVKNIKEIREKIYKKAKVNSLDGFKKFCKENKERGYDRYVPQKFFQGRASSIRILPSENAKGDSVQN